MIFSRKHAWPNAYTFTIKPIKNLLQKYVLASEYWADPFAGWTSPAQVKNDLNPERNVGSNIDALDFLKGLDTEKFDGVLFDPPYSISQAAECYKSYGKEKLAINVANMGYWSRVKNEIARILKPEGKVICFGWNSMGLGIQRGFTMIEVLLVPHGGSKNDTICTVELKRPMVIDYEARRGADSARKKEYRRRKALDMAQKDNKLLG